MTLRTRTKAYRFGDIEIRIETPRDLDQITNTEPAFPLFAMVWESSEILAELILGKFFAGELKCKRILEVGCGMGLVSHLLNSVHADITAMDIYPVTEDLLARNASLNHADPIPFVSASWSDDLPDLGDFDLILGSDLLYEPRHITTLAPFLNLHARSRSSEVILVDPDRGQSGGFREKMAGYWFDCKSYRPEFLNPSRTPYKGVVDQYSR